MNIRIAIISSIIALALISAVGLFFIQGRETPEEARVFSQALPQTPAPSAPRPAVFPEAAAAFDFEVVASDAARAQGLSGRTEVPANYGMLFVFDREERYGFWMKDMLVSIDMIWLASDGTIVGIEENVSPATYPKPFYPPTPVRLVLETRPGEAAAHGWTVGSRIALPL